MVDQSTNTTIDVVIRDSNEAIVFIRMMNRLNQIFREIPNTKYTFSLRFFKSLTANELLDSSNLVIVSMLGQVDKMAQYTAVKFERYREELFDFFIKRDPPSYICTIFRAASMPSLHHDEKANRLEAIARLNLMAIQLSQVTGVGVIDIDRCLAHYGANKLQSGYSLESEFALHLGGDAMVTALVTDGLDNVIPDAHLRMAQKFQGNHFMQQQRLNNLIKRLDSEKSQGSCS